MRTQPTVPRESVADNLPDVSMQVLNRQTPLVEKGITQSLELFFAAEADFEAEGYYEAMLSLSTFDDIDNPIFWFWNSTGNVFIQALL